MRIPYRIRIRYGYARDTARIRIHAVSAYPSLIGPETHDWKRLSPLLDTACERGGRRGPPERGGGVDGRRRPDARRRGRQAAAVEPEVDGAEGWRRPDARRGGRAGEEGAALAGRESHGEGRIAARRCSPRRCDLSPAREHHHPLEDTGAAPAGPCERRMSSRRRRELRRARSPPAPL